MKLSSLFERCLNITYIQAENGADYAIEHIGATLYIYFEPSKGVADWKNNFSFPAKPYKRMEKTVWFAHRGFLKVWKTIEDHIAENIMDMTVNKIIITGYSHGAAIAALCHEYAWYHRADLQSSIYGYGFASPRVFWGPGVNDIRERWENFTVIRNINDIVTHMPPAVLGFTHVGKLIKIGKHGKYSMVDAHKSENIMTELRNYENAKTQSSPATVTSLPVYRKFDHATR